MLLVFMLESPIVGYPRTTRLERGDEPPGVNMPPGLKAPWHAQSAKDPKSGVRRDPATTGPLPRRHARARPWVTRFPDVTVGGLSFMSGDADKSLPGGGRLHAHQGGRGQNIAQAILLQRFLVPTFPSVPRCP